MLLVSFIVLSLAVLLGTVLAVLHLRGTGLPAWWVGALHGLLGAAGLAVLALAWRGRKPGLTLVLHIFLAGMGYLLLSGFALG